LRRPWKEGSEMALINRETVKLIEDVAVGCGMLDDDRRRMSTPYQEVDASSKLVVHGHVGPGSKVKVFWNMGDEDVDEDPWVDDGYVFTLPGWDSGDIYMSGIVHIPEPEGCEKSECDPEWVYLSRLLENPYVERVEIT
jgi:hypothetical protein